MVTTSKGTIPRNRSGNPLPEFALKIREVRKACGPTQARFAKKIGKNRTTVARWETGTREPGAEDYAVLRRFAQEKSLDCSLFFLERERAGKVSLEEKIKRNAALQHLKAIEHDAAAGRVTAKSHLEWADRDPVEVYKHLYGEMQTAREKLTNGDFSLKAKEIFSRIAALEDIWLGREVRAGRAIEFQRRQNKRLLAFQKRRSRAVNDQVAAEKEIFETSIARVKSFLDELSEPVGLLKGLRGKETQEKIADLCSELSSGFRIVQDSPEYSSYSCQILDALQAAVQAIGMLPEATAPRDLQPVLAALQWTLSHVLPATKANE